MLTRRTLLVGGVAGACAALLSRSARDRLAHASPLAGPRYWLQIVPRGGIDAIYTTDPRTRGSVLPGVDVPYDANKIVTAGGSQLGPHFKALAPWTAKLAIVNGVRVNTANHHTGVEQIARMRTGTTWRSDSVFEVLAAHRQGQAVGAVSLGIDIWTMHTASFIGQPVKKLYGPGADLFSAIDELTPEDFTLAATTIDRRVASFKRSGASSLRERRRITALEDSARLFRRLIDTPKLERKKWQVGEAAGIDGMTQHSANLQRALWLFENDLASSVTVSSRGLWDTHFENDMRQGELNPVLATNLVRLFQELESRSNKHGKLSDQTAVIVGSEIGRLPYPNLSRGKDHFPQVPMLLFGKWFQTGKTYGDTDKELNSHPVSLATGRPDRAGHRVVLDDVGVTMLRLAGIDPELHGFFGNTLDFLVRI